MKFFFFSWRRTEHTDRNVEYTTGSFQNQTYSQKRITTWCYHKPSSESKIVLISQLTLVQKFKAKEKKVVSQKIMKKTLFWYITSKLKSCVRAKLVPEKFKSCVDWGSVLSSCGFVYTPSAVVYWPCCGIHWRPFMWGLRRTPILNYAVSLHMYCWHHSSL